MKAAVGFCRVLSGWQLTLQSVVPSQVSPDEPNVDGERCGEAGSHSTSKFISIHVLLYVRQGMTHARLSARTWESRCPGHTRSTLFRFERMQVKVMFTVM